MKAPPSSPVTWLSLLLGVPLLLVGCRHAEAIATPPSTPLPQAQAMAGMSRPELLGALTKMIRGAQHVRHFSADEVAAQLGHPLQSNAEGPVYFGTELALADGSKFMVLGVGAISPPANRLDLEFEPAPGQCPLSVAALQPVLADAGATPAQWQGPIRFGSVAEWDSRAGSLLITATVDGKYGAADTDACIQRISLQILGEH
ncbi:hypothetical protein ABB30_07895 [Stenotrophomonas ginsengisoli]|uniref:Uncharacterized protein n=1 Tax=Stenotrophomonas ginsengisoli TaxID=336566 RepID=A0A0R0D5H8_9GAMM|nr:hypothetical protein [Stenotrophomonas ginsengisoli]KRG77404.1 hypothetical protein ABB30_07895 [Stenotrophomonas ginsengisoli]